MPSSGQIWFPLGDIWIKRDHRVWCPCVRVGAPPPLSAPLSGTYLGNLRLELHTPAGLVHREASDNACPMHVLSQFHSLRRLISGRGRLFHPHGWVYLHSILKAWLCASECVCVSVCVREAEWGTSAQDVAAWPVNDETPHTDVVKTGRGGGGGGGLSSMRLPRGAARATWHRCEFISLCVCFHPHCF